MPKYAAPVSDFRFILSEVLEIETFGDLPGFEDVNTALINAILDEAGKFTSEVIAPLNQVGDKEGCTHHTDGSVVTPPGFKEAYDKLMNSKNADMQNINYVGGASSITAAQFLQRFILNKTPWAHLDIAGMAFSKYGGALNSSGATGYGVRLLNKLVEDYYE